MNGDGLPTVGQPTLAPPIVLQAPNGQRFVVPQVFVAQINLPIMQEIAARTAVAAAAEVLRVLEERGIIPAPPEQEQPDATEPESTTTQQG